MPTDPADDDARLPPPANVTATAERTNGSRPAPRPMTAELTIDEQSRSDNDQTGSDSDQTLSDADQRGSYGDRSSADTHQLAADRDQLASGHDPTAGVSPRAYAFSREIRRRSARERHPTARTRLQGAARRDAIGPARDLTALARDQAADARDLAMAQLDTASAQRDEARALTGAEVVVRAAGQRKRAAQARARAAEHRALAAADRDAAALEREHAARERLQGLADREAFASDLEDAATDALTGARPRAAGLTDLDRDLERACRMNSPLVVAYVDVVGLKALNDSNGHRAGDELLKDVVALIRAHLRPYDLIVRVGGDEFVCAMSYMTVADARERFSQVAAALARVPDARGIRTGFAQRLPHDDSADELIARADQELVNARGQLPGRSAHMAPPPHDPRSETRAPGGRRDKEPGMTIELQTWIGTDALDSSARKLGKPAGPGNDRDRAAEDRDQRAVAHDRESDARDSRADARDERADTREQAAGVVDAAAVADRAGALRDRRRGASDRIQAADDRHAAASDRLLSAQERAAYCIDQLTGAHRRETGLVELEREITRAKRTNQPFTLAFVDVDHLKQTNDAHGHAAGDQRLRRVADTIRTHLRSYDLIIRYGGDEFVCALPDVTRTQAADRCSRVNADLAGAGQGSVSVGLTELETNDSLEDLIERADDAMYTSRRPARSAGR